jgi:hypothetical protein
MIIAALYAGYTKDPSGYVADAFVDVIRWDEHGEPSPETIWQGNAADLDTRGWTAAEEHAGRPLDRMHGAGGSEWTAR